MQIDPRPNEIAGNKLSALEKES